MKFFLLKRKLLTLGASLLCAAAMFYIVSHPAVIGAAGAARQLPIYCVQRDQKVVSLSFDAAWGDVILRRGLRGRRGRRPGQPVRRQVHLALHGGPGHFRT